MRLVGLYNSLEIVIYNALCVNGDQTLQSHLPLRSTLIDSNQLIVAYN